MLAKNEVNETAESNTVNTTASSCRSCNADLRGPFCDQCGKRQPQLPLTLGGLMHEAWERVLQWESSLLRTIGLLLWRPARVLRAFIGGQRLRYTHPITLLLITATLSLLVTNSYGESFWQQLRAQMVLYAGDSLPEQNRAAFAEFYVWLMAALPYWLLLFSLPIAAFVRFAFPRRAITVAEAWVVSLYAAAIAILLDIVVTHSLRHFDVALAHQMSATNLLLLLFNVWYFACWLGWQLWTLLRIVVMVVLAYGLVGVLQSVVATAWALSRSVN